MTRLVVAVLLLAACSKAGISGPSDGEIDAPRVVSAADYDRSCAGVDDCVPVFLGQLDCCATPCPNATINKADLTRYMTDVSQRRPVCKPAVRCPGCAGNTARIGCEEGICQWRQNPPDGGARD